VDTDRATDKEFWLPLAGGLVWTAGSVCAFRATELIGLTRAAGTWTPLNIIVAFATVKRRWSCTLQWVPA
jgi:glucose uptake protein GlcU